MLYWSGEHTQLSNTLCQADPVSSPDLFFWMAILNNSHETQTLYDRTFEWMAENKENHILEYITMMIKAQQSQSLFEYLINNDHIE